MVKVQTYQELLTYLNGLGIVHPSKPIGWRQKDLCSFADDLQVLAGEYPFSIHYHRAKTQKNARYGLRFTVNGRTWALPYDARSNRPPREVSAGL
jgi:hypothetical protein